jgi:hypothetical protein
MLKLRGILEEMLLACCTRMRLAFFGFSSSANKVTENHAFLNHQKLNTD